MSGWSNVKLADVKVEKKAFAPIPAGNYTFTLFPGGAAYRERTFVSNGESHTVTELNVRIGIVSDGPAKGRQLFVTYADPESVNSKTGKTFAWVLQALKKLELAIGIDSLTGEDVADYLNRAGTQNATFGGTLEPNQRNFVREGQTEPETELNVFSVHPAVA